MKILKLLFLQIFLFVSFTHATDPTWRSISFEDELYGNLTLQYQAVLKPSGIPYIYAKWIWTGSEQLELKPEYFYKLCLEIGRQYDYTTLREKLRWVRRGDAEQWSNVVETEYEPAAGTNFAEFCARPAVDVRNKYSGTGISSGNGTLGLANNTATVEWNRPFDPEFDDTLSLIATHKYKAWIMLGICTDEKSSHETEIHWNLN